MIQTITFSKKEKELDLTIDIPWLELFVELFQEKVILPSNWECPSICIFDVQLDAGYDSDDGYDDGNKSMLALTISGKVENLKTLPGLNNDGSTYISCYDGGFHDEDLKGEVSILYVLSLYLLCLTLCFLYFFYFFSSSTSFFISLSPCPFLDFSLALVYTTSYRCISI